MGTVWSLLKSMWEAWKQVARKIANFQARVLLLIFYGLILAPFALAVKWASDPLAIKPGGSRGWRERPDLPSSALERARRQF
jgi:hypothetical protein